MAVTESITIELSGNRSYPVYFSPLQSVAELLRHDLPEVSRSLIVTDENVCGYYQQELEDLLGAAGIDARSIVLPPGEKTKSADTLHDIYDDALRWGIDRQTPLLALGGGVIGDIGGFAAATLLRGIPLVHIPTSAIAQVDSSIGGKTGINHPVGKNLIGAFYQPYFVLIDTDLLQSLPEREWTSGLAEAVKHSLIGSKTLFAEMQAAWPHLAQRSPRTIRKIIPTSAAVKAGIVARDERETGIRAVLNFGHTYGHAIERVAGYGAFTHGEAVVIGMAAALHLSYHVHPKFEPAPALELINRIPLHASPTGLDFDEMYDAMIHDKKTRDGVRRFVLLRDIGQPFVTSCNDKNLLAEAWHSACSTIQAV